jgi:hypothetical protein
MIKNTFCILLLFALALGPKSGWSQYEPKARPDHSLKVSVAPLLFSFLVYPIPSLHYEHQIATRQSLQVGVYVTDFKEYASGYRAGINFNYRYYLTKTERLQGAYLGAGISSEGNITTGEMLSFPVFRPSFGIQESYKNWVYDFGFAVNIGYPNFKDFASYYHFMMGVGYRI